MKEKGVGIMVKEKKEGGLELHLFPSKEAMARRQWQGGEGRTASMTWRGDIRSGCCQ